MAGISDYRLTNGSRLPYITERRAGAKVRVTSSTTNRLTPVPLPLGSRLVRL